MGSPPGGAGEETMMQRRILGPIAAAAVIAAGVGGVLGPPARAADALAAGEATSRAAQETVTAAEEIAVVRALAPFQLTRSQFAALLPALESAHTRLTDLDQK